MILNIAQLGLNNWLSTNTSGQEISDVDVLDYQSRVTSNGGTLLPGDALALQTFATTLKTNSIWNKIKDMGFFMGGFAGSKVKLKAPVGIENLTLTNFVSGDYTEALGLKVAVAGTKKCMTGFIPTSQGLSNTNFSMGYFMTEPNNSTNFYFMLDNKATGLASAVVGNNEIKALNTIGPVVPQTIIPYFSSIGLATANCIAVRDFLNYLTPSTVNPPTMTMDTEISMFFGRNNGVDLYSAGAISFYYIGEYLTYDETVILADAVKEVLITKGRYTESSPEYFGYGDSITFGQSATTPITQRFLSILAANAGFRERNLGRSGSRTINNQGSTPGGNPTKAQVGNYPFVGGSSKIHIQYGINDANSDTGDGSDAFILNYQNNLISIIQYFQSLGFSNANISIGSISYWTAGTLTATGRQKYVTAAYNAAVATGVKYVNVFGYMEANGGASLIADGVHPNTSGHAAMATAIQTLAAFVP